MKKRDDPKVGHPIQRYDLDISKTAHYINNYGDGKSKPVKMDNKSNSVGRSPDDIMRSMGFEPSRYMNPLQFLLAVINDDLDALFKNEKRKARIAGKGGVSVNHRLAAAQTASRYFHMELPKIAITKDETDRFGESLAEAIESGNDRVRTRRIIMEEVERISPDIPLAPASYPPELEQHINGTDVEDDIEPEGDMDYDPDDDE